MTPLERAARVLAKRHHQPFYDRGDSGYTPEYYADRYWRDYVGQVEAVIAATSEPNKTQASDSLFPRFWWLRDRRYSKTTVAAEKNGEWVILGGASGWWTREQVEEDYEVLGAVAPEPVEE